MREILFRAKAINRDKGYHRSNYKNGDWVCGLITRLYDERFENLPAEMTDLNGVSGIEIDHNTICQYTSLTDKNGNKIWENDVIRYSDEASIYDGVVRFGRHEQIVMLELGFYVEWVSKETECFKTDICYWVEKRDIEVIGNIFDNADLMK